MRSAILAAALALAAGPVLAQALPETSRSEAITGNINRSLDTQNQLRGIQQQQQFENNQIRSEVQRGQTMPQVDSRGRIR